MDSSEAKYNQKRGASKGGVEDEVQRLLRKGGKVSATDFAKLRQRHGDSDLADKIQSAFVERQTAISKKAKKFAQLIREKYSNTQYPFHVLLEKAYLFKTKHGLSNDEFAEFQRIYEQELVGLKSTEVVAPANNMTRVLGSVNIDFQGFSGKLGDNDARCLQEILKIYSVSRPLHAQILLQSLQYKDCDFEALTGEYKRELGHRPGEHVHPVVAAMFLPKIDELESHFLHANLAGLVKSRYNGEPITSLPDYKLFYSLTTDPNDIVCDNRSPLMDLLNRVNLQQQLWNCVLNLRNGQYYNASFRDFVASVDMCRLNRQDTPDLIYGRYDGTVVKRLLSAFSFRPTIIATSPVYTVVNVNPYQQNVRPTVTAVPMINLKLQASLTDNAPVSLNDALEQDQLVVEGQMFVRRNTSLIWSRGVLFFFVDRRTNMLRLNDLQPFNLANMPTAISGFERLNDREVDFRDELEIRGDRYRLRSVVLAEVNRNLPERNIIVGSSAMCVLPRTDAGQAAEYFVYDPISVVDPLVDANFQTYRQRTQAVRQLHYGPASGALPGDSFVERARQRGVIFMYEAVTNNTSGQIAY